VVGTLPFQCIENARVFLVQLACLEVLALLLLDEGQLLRREEVPVDLFELRLRALVGQMLSQVVALHRSFLLTTVPKTAVLVMHAHIPEGFQAIVRREYVHLLRSRWSHYPAETVGVLGLREC
jgi:hypothetical protein